jgi:hypothetical protein
MATPAKIPVPGYQTTEQLDRGGIERTTQQGISDALTGKSSSMPRELVEEKKRELAIGARTRAESAGRALDYDAIKRGLFRSGIAARGRRELAMSTEAEISSGERAIEVEKMVKDHSDRMQALQMSQTWLDSLRNYELGKERNEIAREQIAATLSLGYAQIAAGKENARIAAGAQRAGLELARDQFEFEQQRYDDSLIDIGGNFGRVPPAVFDRVTGFMGGYMGG